MEKQRVQSKKGDQLPWWAAVGITLLLAAAFFFLGSKKAGFHVDEMYTFGLSNHAYLRDHSTVPVLESGKHYNGQEIWNDYMTVAAGQRFDYRNVWMNQAHDVHPPLYYLLIHTLCSLFPDMSLVWIGLLVNVPLSCVALWQLVWLGRRLGISRRGAWLLALSYLLTTEFLSDGIAFFRMYTLFMVWIQLLAITLLDSLPEASGSRKYYLLLGISLLGGVMTQYYFLLAGGLFCLTYGVFLALHHNWKKLAGSAAVGAAALAAGVLIFPACIQVFQQSNRAKQARESLLAGNWGDALKEYLKLVDARFFGDLLPVAAVLVLVLLVASKMRGQLRCSTNSLFPYALLLLPPVLYMLLLAKIAPYQNTRYIFPVMGLVHVAVFAALLALARLLPRYAAVVVWLLAGVMTVSSYRYPVDCLYLERSQNTARLMSYQNVQTLYLYEIGWKVMANFPDLRVLEDVVFLTPDTWEGEKNTDYGKDGMIVFLSEDCFDKDQTLQTLMQANGFTQSSYLFGVGYTATYYLE